MTEQQIYDTVLTGLRKQGVGSREEGAEGDTQCAYRGDNGCKCAVGLLIPDDMYYLGMEGKNVGALRNDLPEYLQEYGSLLAAMQRAHDSDMPIELGDSMEYWEKSMAKIAEEYGLTYRPPQDTRPLGDTP